MAEDNMRAHGSVTPAYLENANKSYHIKRPYHTLPGQGSQYTGRKYLSCCKEEIRIIQSMNMLGEKMS